MAIVFLLTLQYKERHCTNEIDIIDASGLFCGGR